MKLFVFKLGDYEYQIQNAVVFAETREEAWSVLQLDQAARGSYDEDEFDEVGYSATCHGADQPKQLLRVVDGPVAYTYGVDG